MTSRANFGLAKPMGEEEEGGEEAHAVRSPKPPGKTGKGGMLACACVQGWYRVGTGLPVPAAALGGRGLPASSWQRKAPVRCRPMPPPPPAIVRPAHPPPPAPSLPRAPASDGGRGSPKSVASSGRGATFELAPVIDTPTPVPEDANAPLVSRSYTALFRCDLVVGMYGDAGAYAGERPLRTKAPRRAHCLCLCCD